MPRYMPSKEQSWGGGRAFKDCERIAVCLYGQYRTGDFVLRHYEKLFSDRMGVKVDFFCSSKVTRSYPHSYIAMQAGIAEEQKVHTVESLSEHLRNSPVRPVAVNVIDDVEDELASGVKWGKIFNGIGDAIRLKSIHEADNDFTYDVVIVSRYDCLIHPIDLLDRIIHWHNSVLVESLTYNFNNVGYNNYLVSDALDRNSNTGILGSQDILFWGSSFSMDLIYAEILHTLKQYKLQDHSHLPHSAIPERLDGHKGVDRLAANAGVGQCRIWPVNTPEGGLAFLYDLAMRVDSFIRTEPHAVLLYDSTEIAIVRETADLEGLDPSDPQVMHDLGQYWVRDGWEAFTKVWSKDSNEPDAS